MRHIVKNPLTLIAVKAKVEFLLLVFRGTQKSFICTTAQTLAGNFPIYMY